MPPRKVAPVFKSIESRMESATEAAVTEIRELKKDLTALERALTGKKKPAEHPVLDVVHSAFEIFRNASVVFDGRRLVADMEEELESAAAEEKLEKRGATLLTKPEGWHWISPAGEMHFLAAKEEPEKALDKLSKLKSRKKKPAAGKAPAKKKADEKKNSPS